MLPSFFCPGFQQGRNRSPVVGDQCQPLPSGFRKAGGIISTQKIPALPLHKVVNYQRTICSAEAGGDGGGNVLVEKQPKHAIWLCPKVPQSSAATSASEIEGLPLHFLRLPH